MPRSPTRLFAAALVLALGACEARQLGNAPAEAGAAAAADTVTKADPSAQPDTTKATAAAPPKPAADTCDLRRALEVWSDSAPAEKRYAVRVAVQLAWMEVASAPRPTPTGATPAVDSTAAPRACAAARERDFGAFVTAYRGVNRATMLDEALVGRLTLLGRQLAESARTIENAPSTPAGTDSTDVADFAQEQPAISVEVPRVWLAALLGFVAVASLALGYALWRLGGSIGDSERHLSEGHQRQETQIAAARDEIVRNARSLQDEVGTAHKTTRAEITNAFARVGTDVASLRESVARSSGGSAGTVPPSGGSGDSRLGAGGGLELDDDPFAQWEETTVDVRPADGGSSVILADRYGLFTIRWALGSSAEGRLSVDPSRTFGAGLRDKLTAAFQRRGASRGTDRYSTLEDARCTWDPSTGQGRIIHPGVVEEV